MASVNKGSEPLENLSSKEIADIVRSNEALDQEKDRIIEEEQELKKAKVRKSSKERLRRLRKSPLEVMNRLLFFIFIGSFLFSFVSVYSLNSTWFYLYVISAFSCILYAPNRQALKELIAAWPNIEDLLRNKRLWK